LITGHSISVVHSWSNWEDDLCAIRPTDS